MSSDDGIAGRTALVTGGTRGIGAAISEKLADLGAVVIATYANDADAARAFGERVNDAAAGTVETLQYDLGAAADTPGSAEALLRSLADRPVDILVVNAAAPYPKDKLLDLSPDVLEQKVAADVGGTHRLVRGLAPAMADRGFGRIVIVGSEHSLGPTAPGMTANGVAKAAVAAYVEYAVDELTGPGITVNLVEPGFVLTDNSAAHIPERMRQMLATLIPAGRAGQPDDVAATICWLVSDPAEYVNGARIPVTGGLNHPVAVSRVAATHDT